MQSATYDIRLLFPQTRNGHHVSLTNASLQLSLLAVQLVRFVLLLSHVNYYFSCSCRLLIVYRANFKWNGKWLVAWRYGRTSGLWTANFHCPVLDLQMTG